MNKNIIFSKSVTAVPFKNYPYTNIRSIDSFFKKAATLKQIRYMHTFWKASEYSTLLNCSRDSYQDSLYYSSNNRKSFTDIVVFGFLRNIKMIKKGIVY